MPELLFEILSEEIPAKMQTKAAGDLARLACEGLEGIGIKRKPDYVFSTPRRLTLAFKDLPSLIDSKVIKRKGPRLDAPSSAINGFLRSVSRPSIEHPDIEIVKSNKGDFFEFKVTGKPQPIENELPKILGSAMEKLPWPKSMRWSEYDCRWIRPIHNILAIFDGRILEFSFNLKGGNDKEVSEDNRLAILANNKTVGHRFLAPDEISINSICEYKEKLHRAFVILESGERRANVKKKAIALAASKGLILRDDPELLEEVTGLIEWPIVLMGRIDKEFMGLPSEVLVVAMKSHQKYFSCLDQQNKLADRFILVSNIDTKDKGKRIIAGNQQVLRARLNDARFFWKLGARTSIGEKNEKLKDRVFHENLGSMADKVERMEKLATEIAKYVPGCKTKDALLAVRFSKADLSTEMVNEFPELQGIVGRYYALKAGEKLEIADAIAEHYSPLGPSDKCPSKPLSVCVALADKLDLLTSLWSIGEKPSGSKDPFALRRSALGIIRLLLENKLRISLGKIFSVAFGAIGCRDKGISDNLLSFFIERLKFYLKDKGMRHDCIDAVFVLGDDDLVRILSQVKELGRFLDTEDGKNILIAYRRAVNILRIEEKKDNQTYAIDPDPNLFKISEEMLLHKKICSISKHIKDSISEEDFPEAMSCLAKLRVPIDRFFDEVTVNATENNVRINRLRLLASIRSILHCVADFSLIEG